MSAECVNKIFSLSRKENFVSAALHGHMAIFPAGWLTELPE